MEEGSVYSWERAVYGGTSLPVWATFKDENIVTLQASWRFGPSTCEYQRAVYPQHIYSDAGLWSPLDERMEKNFTYAELERVPQTLHRLVVYMRDIFYYSQSRGYLLPSSKASRIRRSQVDMADGEDVASTDKMHVAGS